MNSPEQAPPPVPADRFPVRIWLISLAGWMFDFYDLVLFSFLLVPIGRELALTPGQEATLLGVALDAAANAVHGPRLSTAGSRASAWAIPTNEELMIARHTHALLSA